MNPTALITGNITNTATGAQMRGSAGSADALTFQKHLGAGNNQGQNQAPTLKAQSGFTGILNSVANLMNGTAQEESGQTLTELLEEGVTDGIPVEGKGLEQDALTEGVGVKNLIDAQAGLGVTVITPETQLPLPVVQNEGEKLLVAIPMQATVMGSRNPVNLIPAENVTTSSEVVGKVGKPDAMAAQLILPELKRAAISETKLLKDDLAGISVQNGVTAAKGQETLKVSNIQQFAGLQNILSERDAPGSSTLRTEGVLTSFTPSVTTVLKEVVTDRQISATSAVTEKTVVEQLSNGMLKVSSREAGKVVVKLSPEHLGNVEVTLSKKNGQTMVRVVVDRSETLDIVRTDIRALERTLIESGIDVRSNSISLALKSSNGDEDTRSFNENPQSAGPDISINREISEIPRRVIEGRGSVLNIRV